MKVSVYPSLCFITLWVVFFSTLDLNAEDWREIDPAEFELTESEIDPGFGAEILFSEEKYKQIFLESSGLFEEVKYYTRFRVYNELGVSQLADWKLVYDDDRGGIRNIRGRTVKPSGEVYELSKDQIFDTELVRTGQVDVAAKSFAFPNVEPGDIVELQYSRKNDEIDWVPVLRFQERLPARRISKRIHPFSYPGFGHLVSRFNFPEADFNNKKSGYYILEKRNVRAIVDEPYSLPDNSLIPTVILYYYEADDRPRKGEDYWKFKARKLNKEGRADLSSSKRIEALSGELTKGKQSDWEKLVALYDYCQNELVNIRYSRGLLTDKERSKIKESNKPQATLERGNGRPDEITYLFGALAKAAGFEPRIAAMHDNRFVKFSGWMVLDFVMDLRYVAIDLDGETRYFRPGNPFLYCGEVEWFAANSVVLEASHKNGKLAILKQKPADHSIRKRSLTGEIDEEGRLTAKVEIEICGYSGWDVKERLSRLEGREEREDYFADEIKNLMPQAKVENIKIINRGSHKHPITVRYDLDIPDYADVTRKRLYFQPFVFGKGAQDVFVSDQRVSTIQFNYAATEIDDISIQIPEGYALEEGSAPHPLKLEPFGEYTVSIRGSKRGEFLYNRTFVRNPIAVSVDAYSTIKEIYQQINIRDQHALGFKRKDSDS